MAQTTFTDGVTLIVSAWLNDVDTVTYSRFGNGSSYTGILSIADTTDATSVSTGSSKNAGGTSIAKALWVGGLANIAGVLTLQAQPILSSLTASQAVFTDGSKGLVSNAITGTGNVVMSASPTLTGTITAAAATFSGAVTLQSTLGVTGTSTLALTKIGAGGSFATAVNTGGLQFDTNASTNGIEWIGSTSGAGYGHRAIDVDGGAGSAIWKLQGRTNSGTFSTVLTVDGTTGLDVTGTLSNTGHGTTASAANTYIDSSTGLISRSTSSLAYKTDVEPADPALADVVLKLNPIWYRSLSPVDNPDWSFYGLGAEDVAKIDPRFVHWKREIVGHEPDEEYEVDEPVTVEVEAKQIVVEGGVAVEKTVMQKVQVVDELPLFDEAGKPLMTSPVMNDEGEVVKPARQRTHSVPRTVKVKKSRQGAPIYGEPKPDAVQYERLVVPLILTAQSHESRLAALEARLQ